MKITTPCLLLLLTSFAGHAEILLQNPRWAQSGRLELTVAVGKASTKPLFETLTIDHLEVGETKPVTAGGITAVVRSFAGQANEPNVLTIAVTAEGYISAAGVPLVALFVASPGPDQQYALLNPKPILDSAAIFDENIKYFRAGLKQRRGCTDFGALSVLSKYSAKYPDHPVAQALVDVVNERFGAGTDGTCATVPVENQVVDLNPPVAPDAKAKSVPAKTNAPAKKRYVKREDGRIWDTKLDKEYVSEAQRRYREQQQRPSRGYDQDDGYGRDPYGRGGYSRQDGYDGQRGYGRGDYGY